jgi:type I restriction enzyme, S subunit
MVAGLQEKLTKPGPAGVIPADWEVKAFADVVGTYIDYRGRTPRKLGMEWGGGDILALSANNVQSGYIDDTKEAYFGSDELYKKWMLRGDCRKGDLLVTMEAPLGNIAQIPDHRKYILSQRVVLVRPKPDLEPDFLFYFLSGSYFRNQLLKNASGSTAQGIQRRKLDSIPLYYPASLTEQRIIAGALSDVDALIVSLDKQIAKKRGIKSGAMQQLLTGKWRLPGFNGNWEVKPLGDVCRSITDGTHFTPQYVTDGIPFYSVESVTSDDFTNTKLISLKEHRELIKRCKPEKGDILMTRIGSIGDTKLIDWDIDASIYVSLALMKVTDDIDPRYLHWYTKSTAFMRDIEARALVNASPKKINMGDIGKVSIQAPPLPEQAAIARILSDMNAEVVTLEAQRNKSRALKQGMMQQLLTGKIRLI